MSNMKITVFYVFKILNIVLQYRTVCHTVVSLVIKEQNLYCILSQTFKIKDVF